MTPFWKNLDRYGTAPALIDARTQKVWSYDALARSVAELADRLAFSRRPLTLLPLRNRIEDIIRYLACIAAGHVVWIYVERAQRAAIAEAIERYRPDLFFSPEGSSTTLDLIGASTKHANRNREEDLNSLLFSLISTSGSSGSTKLVRYSSSNLIVNAQQIIAALDIRPQSRTITALPLSYVYGLSVLHSHLSAGASIVVEDRAVVDRQMWESVQRFKVNTLSGVPWTYQIMRKLGIDNSIVPTISAFTTSGGRTDSATSEWMMKKLGRARIYFMYGQTEASGRIAVLPPELVTVKRGSVGKAVPGGRLECLADGSIVYHGPNVMLGYAERRADLALGDELLGHLDTGDLGYMDNDGFLYISGRKSDLCKVLGVRLHLGEVRDYFEDAGFNVQVRQVTPDRISVSHEPIPGRNIDSLVREVALHFGIPSSSIQVEDVREIARLSNGKNVL